MSHLPFLTVDPDSDKYLTDGTLDPDVLRSSGDKTASGISSTSATSQLVSQMAPRNASSSRKSQVLLFPLAAILSLALSTALHTFVRKPPGYELAAVSRVISEPVDIFALLAWRVLELGVGWFAGYDYYDFASLFVLYSAPYYFLLSFFYEISALSILFDLAINLVSSTIPFFLLRRLNPHNASSATHSSKNILVTTWTVKAYVALFAAALYAVIVYSSLYTWLPVYLINNFSSLVTLERAHNAQLPILLGTCIPLGIAAKDYLFVPSVYYARNTLPKEFDAKVATFGETLAWNVGLTGWGVREDILVKRTVILGLMTLGVGAAKIWGTVEGAEFYGALGWAGVFAAAGVSTGLGFAWVADV